MFKKTYQEEEYNIKVKPKKEIDFGAIVNSTYSEKVGIFYQKNHNNKYNPY